MTLPTGRSFQPFTELQLADWNPRTIGTEQFQSLARSIRSDPAFLLLRPVLVADGPSFAAGGVVYGGNMRTRALEFLYGEGWVPPDGFLAAGWSPGTVPVDVSDITDTLAKERALQDNNSWGAWDDPSLADLVKELDAKGSNLLDLGFDNDILQGLLERDFERTPPKIDPIAKARPGARSSRIDLIYTFNPTHPTCWVAAATGFLLGINSGSISEADDGSGWPAMPGFIDNEFRDYDHQRHLDTVARFKPKYATVRDAMSRAQCRDAGIKYFPVDEILRFAEEIGKYAENVIVIPKFDCLGEIPDKHVLGYSVPSSYAGTPLPMEKFAGRRIHLLGGSWSAQMSHLAAGGEDVVSLDTNAICKGAMWGSAYRPDGTTAKIEQDLGLFLSNPFTTAITISLGAIARAVNDLYPDAATDVEKVGADQLPRFDVREPEGAIA